MATSIGLVSSDAVADTTTAKHTTTKIRRVTGDAVTDAERELITKVIVDAFMSYQPYMDLWTTQREVQERMHGAILGAMLQEHDVYVAERAGEIVGVSMWIAPEKEMPPMEEVAALFGPAMELLDPARQEVAGEWLMGMDALSKSVDRDPINDWWYCLCLAVAPAAQRKGIGSTLLQYQVQRAGGVPLCLNTQSEENVSFYEKNGFAVRADHKYGPLPNDKMFHDRFLTFPPQANTPAPATNGL